MVPPKLTVFRLALALWALAALAAGPARAADPAPAPAPAPGPPRVVRPLAPERLTRPERRERPEPAPPVAWRDPNAALNEARRDKKPVLLDIEVTWSGWCARMQRTTYADPGVRGDIARSFVPARLDAEDEARRVFYDGRSLSHRVFADRFRVATYPTTVFLAPDGTPITRVPGYVAPARFRTLLRYVAEGRYRTTTWEEFAGPPPESDEDAP